MAAYYVNKNAQDNCDHEVHNSGCEYLPDPENYIYLGNFLISQAAVVAGRKFFPHSIACRHCLPECHTELTASEGEKELIQIATITDGKAKKQEYPEGVD